MLRSVVCGSLLCLCKSGLAGLACDWPTQTCSRAGTHYSRPLRQALASVHSSHSQAWAGAQMGTEVGTRRVIALFDVDGTLSVPRKVRC